MEGGAWWATVHGAAKSWARLKSLSMRAQAGTMGLLSISSPLSICGRVEC